MSRKRLARSVPRSVSAEDSALFQRLIGPVRPLARRDAALRPPPPPAQPLQRERDERRVVDELLTSSWDPALIEVGEELSHRRDGVPAKLLRKLKRGQFSIRDELDLHQMNVEAASNSIRRFLAECRAEGRLCVKIIHGKGLRSKPGGPVLKRLTDQILRQREDVLAYASAPPGEGGTGAVIVLLARPRPTS